jgi:hypothetical protein
MKGSHAGLAAWPRCVATLLHLGTESPCGISVHNMCAPGTRPRLLCMHMLFRDTHLHCCCSCLPAVKTVLTTADPVLKYSTSTYTQLHGAVVVSGAEHPGCLHGAELLCVLQPTGGPGLM